MLAPRFLHRMTITAVWLCVMPSLLSVVRANENAALVLLTNGNVLKGDPQVEGDSVILRRPDGSQLRLRRNQVSHIASTLEELYSHRVSQRTYRNASVHAEEARWCLRHGLLDLAEKELEALAFIDPTHPDNIHIKRQIDSARAPRSAVIASFPSAPSTDEAKNDSPSLPIDVSPDAVSMFATRVQPMLINRCGNAGCHRAPSSTQWQLSHLGVNVRLSARMTQRNLAATLPFINMGDPFSSELLRYTTTPHGTSGDSTRGQNVQVASETLKQWLGQLGAYPQPHVTSRASFNSPISSVPMIAPTGLSKHGIGGSDESGTVPNGFAIDSDGELIYDPDGSLVGKLEVDSNRLQGLVPAGYPAPVIGPSIGSTVVTPTSSDAPPAANVSPGAPRPKRLPTVANPFSGDEFNRQYHGAGLAPKAAPK